MRIEEMMQTEVFSLLPTQTITDALQLMHEKKIRHIPIVEHGHLVGLVTDRDIKEALPSLLVPVEERSIYETAVERIMKVELHIGHPLDFIEEAALLFHTYEIGCLPIVSSGQLVGILTKTDLLTKYIELTGADQPSSQIELRVVNEPGVLYEVSKVFKELNNNVLSVLVYPDRLSYEHKILMIRVKTMNPLQCIEQLAKKGFEVLTPNSLGKNQ